MLTHTHTYSRTHTHMYSLSFIHSPREYSHARAIVVCALACNSMFPMSDKSGANIGSNVNSANTTVFDETDEEVSVQQRHKGT